MTSRINAYNDPNSSFLQKPVLFTLILIFWFFYYCPKQLYKAIICKAKFFKSHSRQQIFKIKNKINLKKCKIL